MEDLNERDLFAMLAMAGWIMNGDYSAEEIPRISYDIADAMIKEKEKRDDTVSRNKN